MTALASEIANKVNRRTKTLFTLGQICIDFSHLTVPATPQLLLLVTANPPPPPD